MNSVYSLKFAEIDDLLSWMNLVTLLRYNFPSLEFDDELEKYKHTVIKNINRQSAISVASEGTIVGVLLFSYNQSCLSCMAVHPKHRKNGIATAMIEKMLSTLPPDQDVWVTTFRENDKKSIAPIALYKKLGFTEDEIVMEHNYPHQKLVLHRKYPQTISPQ